MLKDLHVNCMNSSDCLFNLIVDNIELAIFWKDSNLVYQGCNDNFASFMGLERKYIIGKTDFDIVNPENAESFRTTDREVIESKKAIIKKREAFDTKRNERIWITVKKTPLINQDGNVVGVIGTFEDVTEKVDLEGKLNKTEAKYKKLIEVTNTCYVITDTKLNILDANDNFRKMMHMEKDTPVTNKNIRSWIKSRDIGDFDDAFKMLINRQEIINNLEVALNNENNEEVNISINANLIKNGVTEILCLISDISNKKSLEKTKYIKEQKRRERIRQDILELKGQLKVIRDR